MPSDGNSARPPRLGCSGCSIADTVLLVALNGLRPLLERSDLQIPVPQDVATASLEAVASNAKPKARLSHVAFAVFPDSPFRPECWIASPSQAPYRSKLYGNSADVARETIERLKNSISGGDSCPHQLLASRIWLDGDRFQTESQVFKIADRWHLALPLIRNSFSVDYAQAPVLFEFFILFETSGRTKPAEFFNECPWTSVATALTAASLAYLTDEVDAGCVGLDDAIYEEEKLIGKSVLLPERDLTLISQRVHRRVRQAIRSGEQSERRADETASHQLVGSALLFPPFEEAGHVRPGRAAVCGPQEMLGLGEGGGVHRGFDESDLQLIERGTPETFSQWAADLETAIAGRCELLWVLPFWILDGAPYHWKPDQAQVLRGAELRGWLGSPANGQTDRASDAVRMIGQPLLVACPESPAQVRDLRIIECYFLYVFTDLGTDIVLGDPRLVSRLLYLEIAHAALLQAEREKAEDIAYEDVFGGTLHNLRHLADELRNLLTPKDIGVARQRVGALTKWLSTIVNILSNDKGGIAIRCSTQSAKAEIPASDPILRALKTSALHQLDGELGAIGAAIGVRRPSLREALQSATDVTEVPRQLGLKHVRWEVDDQLRMARVNGSMEEALYAIAEELLTNALKRFCEGVPEDAERIIAVRLEAAKSPEGEMAIVFANSCSEEACRPFGGAFWYGDRIRYGMKLIRLILARMESRTVSREAPVEPECRPGSKGGMILKMRLVFPARFFDYREEMDEDTQV
jgi:hypothetical protein